MARRRMVTRSFYTTNVKAIVFNNETNKTGVIDELLAGAFKDESAALKALKSKYKDDEKILPVKVIGLEVDSALYGIEENEFLKIAKKLDNRNNQVSDEQDTDDMEE